VCSNTDGAQSQQKRDEVLFSEDVADVANRTWSEQEEDLYNCSIALASTGEYYGTTFVARDMVHIVDALEEDGMLRYYGMWPRPLRILPLT
jgi:hypothetical protein